MITPSSEMEDAVATFTLYSALLSEWLVESGMQDRLGPVDILLWWARAPVAES